MNLDDLAYFQSLDPHNLLKEIDAFPDQIASAWALGHSLSLPADCKTVRHIVIIGMGGAAIAGELAQVLTASESSLPVTLLKNYALPAFVGNETLVIGLSRSGNTEETLVACESALACGAKLLVITQGGQLAALAEQPAVALWRFGEAGQPRLALGYLFMLTLAALMKLGCVSDKSAEVAEAVEALRAQQNSLRAESPVRRNPAKRLAGQIMERLGAIFASDYLTPVARRWKMLINEFAKAWAVADELPEMDHHAVSGTLYPEALVSKYMVLFLRSTHAHPRNRLRADVTRELYMTAGFNTDAIEATGQSPLAHMLTALHYGDYTAYYLAMCYGIEPGSAPQVEYVKGELQKL
jgi:glucose/mannose-6-phosphate isomerase